MIRFPFSIETLVAKLPPHWAAAIDYRFRPHLSEEGGGPFNGQEQRQRVVRDLLRVCRFQAIVEIGTLRGSTTEFLARDSKLPVFSVEATPRYYHYAGRRLRSYPRVRLTLGESRIFVEQLAGDSTVPRENVFFYLGPHWYESLPLREELTIIFRRWAQSVVMIDNFEVPGDPGYAFDDRGPGTRLSLDYLDPLRHFNFVPFFPSTPSERETGKRRGCVVLAARSAAGPITLLDSLRAHAEGPELGS